MLPTPLQILWAVVLPLAASFAIWGGWYVLVPRVPRLASFLAVCSVLVSYGLAFFSKDALSSFPPGTATPWLFFSLPVLALIAGVESWQGSRRWLAPLLWLLAVAPPLVLVVVWREFPSASDDADARRQLIRQAEVVIGSGVVLAMLLRATAGHMVRQVPATTAWILALTAGFAAPIVIFAGSTPFNPTFRVSSLGFAIAPATILFLFRKTRTRPFPLPVLTPFAALLVGTLAATYLYYEDFPWYVPLVLLLAPILPALVPTRYVGWRSSAARLALALLPLVTLFGVMLAMFLRNPPE
jgi:hypothetical protein